MRLFSKHTIAAILLTGTAFVAHAGSELIGPLPFDGFWVLFAHFLHDHAFLMTAAALSAMAGFCYAGFEDRISTNQTLYGIGTMLLAGLAISIWVSQTIH